MLLSDRGIRSAMLGGDLSLGENFDSLQVQPSSIDLKVGHIFAPGPILNKNTAKDLSALAFTQYALAPGESVIVEIDEDITLGLGYGGLMLPPNSLSKNGIIMTNPGHVDPGYTGKLTVCLINMGAQDTTLEAGQTVATLLLFKLDTASTGYAKGYGKGVSFKQLSMFAKDFANLNERSSVIIGQSIRGHLVGALAIISLFVAVMAVVTPGLAAIFSDILNNKYVETKNASEIEALTKKVEALSLALTKQQNGSSAPHDKADASGAAMNYPKGDQP